MTSPFGKMHALTFDVEDWYQGFVFRGLLGWERYGSREKQNVERLLSILGDFRTKATFFVLGKFAEDHPEVVSLIDQAGHEISSHGYGHIPLPKHTPASFRDDVRRSLDVLQNITGKKVLGYRAAGWSLTKKSVWAFDILAEEGLEYDSSVFPTFLHKYGFPGSLRFPYRIDLPSGRHIYEFPAQVFAVGPLKFPAAGGFYLRALPFLISRWALLQSQRRGRPGMVYLHPYDLDPLVPRIPAPFTFRIVRYYRLHKTESYLKDLMNRFRFCAVNDIVNESGSTFPVHIIPYRD
jgi:polysaccharide deacetylase family protein (PEP-CTERM system associated)